MRAIVTRSKPLLTPDRALELMQLDWTCDDTRARLDIDYESKVALPDGLRMTAEWYRQQGWLKR
jgi:nucleoside-diphosphate-sugar epimerase